MQAERYSGPNGVIALCKVTLGDLAIASFILCAVSGAILAASYDAEAAARSITGWMLTSSAATFLRSAHYWTAQFSLIFTVLHIWDHLRASTERNVRRGVWLRLVLAIPVVALLMLSGFLLRGDADATQAQRILDTAVSRIPLAGSLLATLFFGTGEGLRVIYIQHAATATIIVWIVIVEHAKRLWPRAAAITAVGAVAGSLSLFLSPGMHDGMDPAVKGPWYFLGLQEILHWTPWSLAVISTGTIALALFLTIPFLPSRWAGYVKRLFFAITLTYVLLCGVGLFLRGENWSFKPNWPSGPGNLRPGIIVEAAPDTDKIPAEIPVVLGRNEGCLICHSDVTGLSDAHRPESVGCASCHGGDVFTLDMESAHAGMLSVPGNLSNAPRACGQADCHETIIPRIEHSIMTTFTGVIKTDRSVFGESADEGLLPHVRDLGTSPADSHLRQLCASCHIGREKTDWGPVTQESRGGGCNACHLSYSPEAAEALTAYEAMPRDSRSDVPRIHPALSIAVDDSHCFGCHSRSGRIATSYEGWQELSRAPSAAEIAADDANAPRFRCLDDGRFFVRVLPDVHQERGLTCIDCHAAAGIMGMGDAVARKSDQVRVSCEDCHALEISSVPIGSIDPEARKLLSLRKWSPDGRDRIGVARAGGTLVNVRVDASGLPRMLRKQTGEASSLSPPLPVCSEAAGHSRLSCNSCHSAWAPSCITCHTSFDAHAEGFDHLAQSFVTGSWIESSGGYAASLPTLGVRTTSQNGDYPSGIVDTFIPGMILSIEFNRDASASHTSIFRRLYARTFAHTIRRESRSCESCHNDPVALGFGRGVLEFEISENTGRWKFKPESRSSPADGLPVDAWTGFLQTRTGMVSARDDVRPFTAEEQRRILYVGACLTCHTGSSPLMKRSVADFEAIVAQRSKLCIEPVW